MVIAQHFAPGQQHAHPQARRLSELTIFREAVSQRRHRVQCVSVLWSHHSRACLNRLTHHLTSFSDFAVGIQHFAKAVHGGERPRVFLADLFPEGSERRILQRESLLECAPLKENRSQEGHCFPGARVFRAIQAPAGVELAPQELLRAVQGPGSIVVAGH